ncbi:MAG: hypothetical protein OHK0052_01170 [Anaerolineales bacterium]
MTNRRINLIQLLRAAGTLLAVVLLGYLLFTQGWQEIWDALRAIPPAILLAALLLQFVSRFAISLRWHVLLRCAALPITLSQSLRITFAGLFANNFLPSTIGGDVIRLAGALRLGLDEARSTASLIVDRLVGMAGMALFVPWGIGVWVTASPAAQMAFPRVAAAAFPRKIWDWLWGFAVRVWQAVLLWLRRPAGLMQSLGWTLLHMVCLFTSLWLMLRGLNDPLPWLQVAGLWSITYFITLLPVSINGLGVQEVSISFLYANLGGVSLHNSLLLALLIRTLFMLASLPGALFVPELIAGQRSESNHA